MGLKQRLLEYLNYRGIKKGTFEKEAGLSNGFVDKAGDNTRTENLDKISKRFPDLNITWLRTGEGEMIKRTPPDQTQIEIVNNQVGNGNHFNSDMTVNQFMLELAAQRKLTEKAQEQMDRLITIIEKMKD